MWVRSRHHPGYGKSISTAPLREPGKRGLKAMLSRQTEPAGSAERRTCRKNRDRIREVGKIRRTLRVEVEVNGPICNERVRDKRG